MSEWLMLVEGRGRNDGTSDEPTSRCEHVTKIQRRAVSRRWSTIDTTNRWEEGTGVYSVKWIFGFRPLLLEAETSAEDAGAITCRVAGGLPT